MTDQDILAQIRQAEEHVVKAAEILHKVHLETAKRTEVPSGYPLGPNAVKRRDDGDCSSLFRALFQMVEPWVIDKREDLSLEGIKNPSYNGKSTDDKYPRGELSCFRYRYEILTGYRQAVVIEKHWDGSLGYHYPRVTGKPIESEPKPYVWDMIGEIQR